MILSTHSSLHYRPRHPITYENVTFGAVRAIMLACLAES